MIRKHDIALNFLWPKSKPYTYDLGKYSKKIQFFSFDFRQNFDVWTFSLWLSEHTQNKFFVAMDPHFFYVHFGLSFMVFEMPMICSQKLHFKIRLFGSFTQIIACAGWAYYIFHRTLSLRLKNFRVCSCSASIQILAVFHMDIQTHAELTRKRFHRLLSIHGNGFIACWA
jgi:hypothetical protein